MKEYIINEHDRNILRDLAKKQYEYSQLPKMQELTNIWYKHNNLEGERPMFTIEMWTFIEEIPKDFKCETELGRQIEDTFYNTFANYEFIGDDTVIPPMFKVGIDTWFKPFDIDVEVEHASNSLGHKFVHKISDLNEDFHLLKKSTYGTNGKEEALRFKDFLESVFGDILPVKFVGNGLYSVPTQNIVHIMSMENMLYSMYDYPEKFKKMMDNLTDDYVEFYKWMEQNKLLLPTSSYGGVGQGTYCFTSELPDDSTPPENLTTKDLWGFMDSQETVGISPVMYNEFIFPYYKKVSDLFGLFSYGCCEPVDSIYDLCLSKCDNLRKISISPWCNEEFMGERLRGSRTIYHRKPSPNYLGVDREFDEDGWRNHIRKTVKAAKGCKLEITQRDVYTLSGNLGKLKRATEIVREECENFY